MSRAPSAKHLPGAGVVLCIGLLCLIWMPEVVSAQDSDRGAGFAITPFGGYRLEYTRESVETIEIGGQEPRMGVREEVSAGALTAGAEIRTPLWRQFGLIGSFTYSFPADRSIREPSESGISEDSLAGSGESILVKAGIAYRFIDRERARRVQPMQAGISISPAVLHRYPADQAEGNPINHWAVAIAADASTGFGGSGMNVYAAVEDYITFWNVQELADRRAAELSDQSMLPAVVQIEADPSHLILLRLGVSFTF